MTDKQYEALNAKLDQILARLQVLEARPVTFNVTTLPTSSTQVKQMVTMMEQEFAGRIRAQTPLAAGWSVPKHSVEGEQGA